MTAVDTRYIAELAAQLRVDSITASTSAGRDTHLKHVRTDLMALRLAGTFATIGPT